LDYVPGKPLVGPDSPLDDALKDRLHRPYPARNHISNVRQLLSDAEIKNDISKERLIDSFIKVHTSEKGEPEVSPKFLEASKTGLKAYPRSFGR
jgi:hypothetical protein